MSFRLDLQRLLPTPELGCRDSGGRLTQQSDKRDRTVRVVEESGHKFRFSRAQRNDETFIQTELKMDRGIDFLKSQVNNAVMQHETLLKALEDHEEQAKDARFRDLCTRHIPNMREHQRMLEEYQSQLGAEMGKGKKFLGAALGAARDLADAARESDFLRLVGDIVLARQSEDTFKTFREAGKLLGNAVLQNVGDTGERHQDVYVKEANRLVQQMFVEHVQDVAPSASQSTSAQMNTSA